jgi:hypothetical protein
MSACSELPVDESKEDSKTVEYRLKSSDFPYTSVLRKIDSKLYIESTAFIPLVLAVSFASICHILRHNVGPNYVVQQEMFSEVSRPEGSEMLRTEIGVADDGARKYIGRACQLPAAHR